MSASPFASLGGSAAAAPADASWTPGATSTLFEAKQAVDKRDSADAAKKLAPHAHRALNAGAGARLAPLGGRATPATPKASAGAAAALSAKKERRAGPGAGSDVHIRVSASSPGPGKRLGDSMATSGGSDTLGSITAWASPAPGLPSAQVSPAPSALVTPE